MDCLVFEEVGPLRTDRVRHLTTRLVASYAPMLLSNNRTISPGLRERRRERMTGFVFPMKERGRTDKGPLRLDEILPGTAKVLSGLRESRDHPSRPCPPCRVESMNDGQVQLETVLGLRFFVREAVSPTAEYRLFCLRPHF